MCVLLNTQLLRLVGRLQSRKPVYHTSWVVVVTLTDRPQSVHNRCVIDVFGGVCALSRCISDFSVGVGAFDMFWYIPVRSRPFFLCIISIVKVQKRNDHLKLNIGLRRHTKINVSFLIHFVRKQFVPSFVNLLFASTWMSWTSVMVNFNFMVSITSGGPVSPRGHV